MHLDFIKECPCPENVLVNTKLLERAIKYCKQMLKNQFSPDNMHDYVKDEFRPQDRNYAHFHPQRPESLNKMFNEKIWNQLVSYSQQAFPIFYFDQLDHEIRPCQKELKAIKYLTDPQKFDSINLH